MGQNTFIIVFFTFAISIVLGGFLFISSQFIPKAVIAQKAIKCANPESTISFLIDDESRTILMAGELLSPKTITIFNKTAISAQWVHNNETTKMFLDRIAGRLKVETSGNVGREQVDKFDCNAVAVRF